ncbi:aldehyde dehydrogenase family protein [Streptosporangium soli]|nr:aldehyde dehydrogenase family protein [Streptosporangium sp. KLBMP 9127]
MTLPALTDPLTGQAGRALTPISPAALRAAADDLRDRAAGWRSIDRGPVLERFAAALAGDDDLLAALVADTGRHAESVLERRLVTGMIERWVRQAPGLLAPPAEQASAIPSVALAGAHVPYELVGAITPWNFPLLLGLIDAIPALAAGCAVLVKPSEVTPRFIEPLSRLIPSELPLRVVEGGAETGAALVGLVDVVAFTGSVPTGRKVAEAAARAFVPAFLELGGKDPAIVLAGADLDRASSAILWGGTSNAGQSCQSIERVYVERAVHDEFVELLVAKARRTGLTCEGGPIGPLIDPAQAGVVERHLADAGVRGAVTRTGGTIERHGGGRWCRPTVLTGVDHSMLVMTEETFGPILPVMPVADAEEAVRLANDSVYGLSAAVFGRSEEEALAVAGRLAVGAVSVNDAALTALVHEGEKNSFGLSGMGGSRMGPASLRRFLRRRSYLVNRASAADPWWHSG